MSRAVQPGRFISIEGGEGTGKSTQIALIAEYLRTRGLVVHTTREPGGTPGAEAIRALLLGGEGERWGARSEALLFAAARADHVERLIRPALAAGEWVVSDRFIDSSRAYQGIASKLGDDVVMTLHAIGSEGLLPDLTILLDLPQEEAERRARSRDGGSGDRIGARDADYHRAVAMAFQDFADAEPERFARIDASGSSEQVLGRIIPHLDKMRP